MEDRIKIGDVWYVREDKLTYDDKEPINEEDITYTVGATFEDDRFCVEFEALNIDGEINMPSLKFTDKSGFEPVVIDSWDNPDFLVKLSQGDRLACNMALEGISVDVLDEVVEFLRIMVEKDWLRED
jgi:hypothetical protein